MKRSKLGCNCGTSEKGERVRTTIFSRAASSPFRTLQVAKVKNKICTTFCSAIVMINQYDQGGKQSAY